MSKPGPDAEPLDILKFNGPIYAPSWMGILGKANRLLHAIEMLESLRNHCVSLFIENGRLTAENAALRAEIASRK